MTVALICLLSPSGGRRPQEAISTASLFVFPACKLVMSVAIAVLGVAA
jgi:hypothetical protein